MSNVIAYKDLTAPAAEPVTLAQAKSQLVVDSSFTADDALITSLIVAARQHCENIMQRAVFNRTMQMNYDFFPYPYFRSSIGINDRHTLYGLYWRQFAIKLARPACVSVTSITYIDLNGVTQTVSPSLYYVDAMSEPARIVPNPGLYWPYSQAYLPGSVKVTYTAGTWGDGVTVNTCPQTICQAMLLLISYYYNHRDAAESNPPKAIEFSVDALLSPYKFDTFGFSE
jgi:uncharacterized phiE125 gp8 family phage protein